MLAALEFTFEQYLFAFVSLAGLAGLVFSLRLKNKKGGILLALASLVLMAAGLWGAFSYAPTQSSFSLPFGSSFNRQASPLPSAGIFDPSKAELLSEQSQVFTQTIQPLVCDKGDLVYWRELRVYNVTKGNKTSTFSTITLFVKNSGSGAIDNFLVKEKLPESVAKTPEEIVGFSITPFAFEEGSVVVDFLFDNIEPGETKQVSYTVDKKLDERVLGEYEPPKAVSATTGNAIQPKKQGLDYTLVGLVVVAVVLGGLIIFFLKRE